MEKVLSFQSLGDGVVKLQTEDGVSIETAYNNSPDSVLDAIDKIIALAIYRIACSRKDFRIKFPCNRRDSKVEIAVEDGKIIAKANISYNGHHVLGQESDSDILKACAKAYVAAINQIAI